MRGHVARVLVNVLHHQSMQCSEHASLTSSCADRVNLEEGCVASSNGAIVKLHSRLKSI